VVAAVYSNSSSIYKASHSTQHAEGLVDPKVLKKKWFPILDKPEYVDSENLN
jgi:hypothetical protein